MATEAIKKPTPTKKEKVISRGGMRVKQLLKKPKISIDKAALKKLSLVAVAFSHVERDMFPTEEAYNAEVEVEDRAAEVAEEIEKLGVKVKLYPGDQYFLTNLLVDKPDLVVNLVDTLKGRDALQTSVPAALELSSVPYTGAGMTGMVIGNNRNLTKRLLMAYDIPTPAYQFIRRAGTKVDESLGVPLIVKLNESGGSVGIDNKAVKETFDQAQTKVNEMISTYKIPVVVEQFIDGPEITACVFDDGSKKHVFLVEKQYRKKADGKHYFTSTQTYEDINAWKVAPVSEALRHRLNKMVVRAFNSLHHNDYAKFDIRIDDQTGIPYFTDSNPNTAFGPDLGLPFTEAAAMYGVEFSELIGALLSKYAKQLPSK
jgi:D-alanine-D-alanine ligase